MKQSRIAALVSVAALLAAGCTHVTPYPASLGEPDAARTTYDWACQPAIASPGSSTDVLTCLLARGRSWEERGRRIRGLSSGLGQALIPATAAGVGLLAAGDTSDAVPVLGLVTGSALTHSSAYARADLARIYEEATAAYVCLTTAVAAWNISAAPLHYARGQVETHAAEVESQIADAMTSATNEQRVWLTALQQTVRNQRRAVTHTLNRIEGDTGVALLDRADAIDAAVRRVVADRMADPRAVYSAASSQITPGMPSGEAFGAAMNALEEDKGVGSLNLTAIALTLALTRFQAALSAFDAAVSDHQVSDAARTRAAACIFNPAEYALPALTATPSEIDLDGDSGTFVIRGGVAPFGLLPPPSGLTAVITPLTGTSALVTVTATTSGSWTLTVIDASTAGATATVTVRKAAAPPPES